LGIGALFKTKFIIGKSLQALKKSAAEKIGSEKNKIF
jgi:hypothetical protein